MFSTASYVRKQLYWVYEREDDEEKSAETETDAEHVFKCYLHVIANAIDNTVKKHRLEKDSFKQLMCWKNKVKNCHEHDDLEAAQEELMMPVMKTCSALRNAILFEDTWREISNDQELTEDEIEMMDDLHCATKEQMKAHNIDGSN